MASNQQKAKLPKESEDHVIEVSLRHVILLFGSLALGYVEGTRLQRSENGLWIWAHVGRRGSHVRETVVALSGRGSSYWTLLARPYQELSASKTGKCDLSIPLDSQ